MVSDDGKQTGTNDTTIPYQEKPIGIAILAMLKILWGCLLLFFSIYLWSHYFAHGLGPEPLRQTFFLLLLSSISILSLSSGIGLLSDAKWSWWLTGALRFVNVPFHFLSLWIFLIDVLVLIYLFYGNVKGFFLIDQRGIKALAIMFLLAGGMFLALALFALALRPFLSALEF